MKALELEYGTKVYYFRKLFLVLRINHNSRQPEEDTALIVDSEGESSWVNVSELYPSKFQFGDKITYKTNLGRVNALFIEVETIEHGTCRVCREDDKIMDTACLDECVLEDWL